MFPIEKELKTVRTKIQKKEFDDYSLEAMENLFDYYQKEMARYEEQMTFKQADAAWGNFDALGDYMYERFPEFKAKKEAEKESMMKGLTIHHISL